MISARHRVAVTGLGAITALGSGVDRTFAGLIAGRSGIAVPTELGADMQQLAVAAEVRGLRVSDVAPAGLGDLYSRADALTLLAASEAIEQARGSALDLALAIGTTAGGVREATPWLMDGGARTADPALCQKLCGYPLYVPAQQLAKRLGSVRQQVTFCSACSSSATAVAQAALWISSGRHSCALAGGAEALSILTLTGFASLGATSRVACRPFDAARAGMTLGEAAAFMFLESEEHAVERHAEILAWLDGWSLGAEANHITQPEPSGETAARLIHEAMRVAQVQASAIGYYNAHGTGTPANDSMETSALRAAFGGAVDRVLVSSCKGQLGHTLGAAGALEAVVTVLALRNQMAPPTVGLVQPAPDTALNHIIGASRPLHTQHALSSSFGFGGLDVVLLFSHLDARRGASAFRPAAEVVITAAIADGSPDDTLDSIELEGHSQMVSQPVGDPLRALDPERSRRFDRLSAVTCVGVETILRAAHTEGLRVGLAVGNALGNSERLCANLARVKARGPRGMPPAEFPHLVHSSTAGNASIYGQLSGPVSSLSDQGLCCAVAIEFASSIVGDGRADAMIAGAVETYDDGSEAVVDPYAILAPQRSPRRDLAHWFLLETAEQARARGQSVRARIVDAAWSSSHWYEYLVEHSPVAQTCLVLDGVDPQAVDGIAQLEAWWTVRRIAIQRRTLQPSGTAGIALLKAVRLLEKEGLAEAVVVSRSGNRTWAVRLAAGARR